MTLNPNIILEIFETISPNKNVNALRFLLKFVLFKGRKKRTFSRKK